LGSITLDDILVTPLKIISTEGGDVMHGLKMTDDGFNCFGEAYFSWINHGVVKAWKKHTRMMMNVVVPVGMVRFAFYDDQRKVFRIEDIGVDRYMRLTVPPGIWFGFQGLSAPQNLVLNISSIVHEPDEVERLNIESIDYNWNKL
jgi:dTDP-4-dehydrorhamnose 3,5-epimerase